MKQIRFFAVDDDLINVLNEVEQGIHLQYVKAGVSPSSLTESYQAGTKIPRLGMATADSAINSDSFLVAERGMPIRSRPVVRQDGGTNFCIDQLENPDTVVLTPAGKWGNVAVLYGTVGTASDTEASIKLAKAFERAVKKHFKKVKAFWVGPNALELLQKGERLTIAVQSPKDFDLSLS